MSSCLIIAMVHLSNKLVSEKIPHICYQVIAICMQNLALFYVTANTIIKQSIGVWVRFVLFKTDVHILFRSP